MVDQGVWCAATFATRFAHREGEFALFPTQRHLFEFLDQRPASGDRGRFLPFCIEFPSESDISAMIKACGTSARRRYGGTHPLDAILGRRRGCDAQAAERGGGPRHPGVVRPREEYTVLYGDRSLSQQTRLFAALTPRVAAELVVTVPPLQQHLYELIREGTPCHLYFDVERDSDYDALADERGSAWPPGIHGEGDGGEPSAPLPLSEPSKTEYDEVLIRRATWQPPHCCLFTCPIRADNTTTGDVMLRELGRYLGERFPDWGVGNLFGDDADVVLVLRSRSINDGAGAPTGASKFSQHYVVKLPDRWFASNLEVGCLVEGFVDWLYRRAAEDAGVHSALFFHAPPVHYPVLPADPPSDVRELPYDRRLPFLPLRCIIDTSVYSRNRTLRCLGSCKLGKTSVLQVERILGRRRVIVDVSAATLFFASLVTWSDEVEGTWDGPSGASEADGNRVSVAPSTVLVRLTTPTRASGKSRKEAPFAASPDWRSTVPHQWLSASGSDVPAVTARLVDYINRHVLPSFPGSGAGYVSRVVVRGDTDTGRYVLLSVEGTRYCRRVQREHRSNRIYLVVDREQSNWSQKCFDPDCGAYRSEPQPLPKELCCLMGTGLPDVAAEVAGMPSPPLAQTPAVVEQASERAIHHLLYAASRLQSIERRQSLRTLVRFP